MKIKEQELGPGIFKSGLLANCQIIGHLHNKLVIEHHNKLVIAQHNKLITKQASHKPTKLSKVKEKSG